MNIFTKKYIYKKLKYLMNEIFNEYSYKTISFKQNIN